MTLRIHWRRVYVTLQPCRLYLAILVAISLTGQSNADDATGFVETGSLVAPEANQAAAVDEKFVYAIDNAVIAKYERGSGRLVARSTGQAEHLNSGFLWQGKLYAAHSNFPKKPARSVLMELDCESMKLTPFKDFGGDYGSLTWAVRDKDSWWCNFAHYGADHHKTVLVKFDDSWRELGTWTYPRDVIDDLGQYSISGGVWRHGELLTTGHDNRVIYRLRLPAQGQVLELVGTISSPFPGQGIAVDAKTDGLVGINRSKRQVVFAQRASSRQGHVQSNIHFRGSLDNSRLQFEQKKQGHVAFMGGSITEMNGYRPMVCELLQKRFPQTEFTFTNAGIASTCSTTGAFRLATDVLATRPVDLFFVEFVVNDDQDAGHARRECIRGLEGIVRHVRKHNPHADIVVTFFVNDGMLKTFGEKQTPLTVASHTEVAEHYGISTIDLAKEVFDQMAAGKLTWKQYGGVHPAPFGNAICARMIDELLSQAWSKPLAADAVKVAHAQPKSLDPLCYENGRFIDPAQATIVQGWKLYKPNWKELKGSSRTRFTDIPMLCAETSGAELKLDFTGTAVGAYVVAGPDAGVAEASIDGGRPTRVNLFHRFSAGLHYPRTVMLGTDLAPGQHTLTLRMTDETHSAGHAMRIVQFVAN